jgi:uncharacterized membrane protein YccF (DUF307 family)
MDDLIANLIIRILWSAFIGWWVTIIWYLFAIVFIALVFSARVGYRMLGYSEMIFSFERESSQNWKTRRRIIFSVIWFYLFGWWLGLLFIILSSVFVVSIIGFPLGTYLMKRLDDVVILS